MIDFANYLAFFPQLVAGPIVRAADLLPQMEAMPGLETRINTSRAGLFILTGLFKKIVVANWLAEHLADPVFSSPETYVAADLVLGVYAYAVQIYCDFSAYSDIAGGCALLLGFTFPFNFNAPYFAARCRTSGAGGTSRSRPGCATTSTSRSGARAAGRPAAART